LWLPADRREAGSGGWGGGAVSGSFEERDLIDSRGAPPVWVPITSHQRVDETTDETRAFTLDHTENLDSHYSDGNQFDSDVERTLAQKWERSNTEWELVREDDVFDLGAEVMIP